MLNKLLRPRGTEAKMSLVDHLTELRQRIIVVIAVLAAGVLVSFYFSGSVVNYLTRLPGKLVYMYPGEAFFVHLKLAILGGLLITSPVILLQLVRFILPALRESERRLLYWGLPLVCLLFLVGVIFAYQVILPLAFSFFMGFGTESLEALISINNYVSFVLGIIIPLGLVFQLPLVVVLLTSLGLLTPESLIRYRKMMILVIFIASAILTPPDVISQFLMAVPMLLLYELSIFCSRFILWRKEEKEH